MSRDKPARNLSYWLRTITLGNCKRNKVWLYCIICQLSVLDNHIKSPKCAHYSESAGVWWLRSDIIFKIIATLWSLLTIPSCSRDQSKTPKRADIQLSIISVQCCVTVVQSSSRGFSNKIAPASSREPPNFTGKPHSTRRQPSHTAKSAALIKTSGALCWKRIVGSHQGAISYWVQFLIEIFWKSEPSCQL